VGLVLIENNKLAHNEKPNLNFKKPAALKNPY
jgi:hypothetical protein